MNKAHVIKLYPTKKQEELFRQSCGVARFAYNWALEQWKRKYQSGEPASANSLIKELTLIKREQFSWMMNVSKTCPQYAIHNLESAFKNFFAKRSKYPRFKKRGIKDSFVAVENKQTFKQVEFKIWIPRLGWVKCAENLRFNGDVNNVTVKRIADMWFAVVNIKTNDAPTVSENQVIVGVDLGIKSLAVVSDGRVFENPRALQKSLKSMKRQQRKLSRKVKGSHNRRKQQLKVARLHYKISNVRKNAIHDATTKIVNSANVIVIENLNVSGMIKNRKLSRALNDVSFHEFRRQIEYKSAWQQKQVVIVDQFYPSSKTCSCCGWIKKDQKLSDRTFNCEGCGLSIDRDLNAAINLANYRPTSKCEESHALGVWSSSQNIVNSQTKNKESDDALFNSVKS